MSLSHFEPFGDPFRRLDRLTSQLLSGTRTPMGMPMDVWQTDDGYHVDLDLPGVDPGSVDITCERNMLTIRAERQPEFGPDQQVLVAERTQGSFTRQLQLGDAVDASKVQASYENGVLHLTIPAAEEARPRRIEVQRGSGERSGPQSVTVGGESGSQSGDDQSSAGQSGDDQSGEGQSGDDQSGEGQSSEGRSSATQRPTTTDPSTGPGSMS